MADVGAARPETCHKEYNEGPAMRELVAAERELNAASQALRANPTDRATRDRYESASERRAEAAIGMVVPHFVLEDCLDTAAAAARARTGVKTRGPQ